MGVEEGWPREVIPLGAFSVGSVARERGKRKRGVEGEGLGSSSEEKEEEKGPASPPLKKRLRRRA